MPWYVASLLANAAIMGVEYINRANPGGWLHALPQTAPLIVVAQWGLYHAWSGAPHWMLAWVVFALGNAALRVAAVYLFANGEVASWGHILAGTVAMLAGAFIIKEGLS